MSSQGQDSRSDPRAPPAPRWKAGLAVVALLAVAGVVAAVMWPRDPGSTAGQQVPSGDKPLDGELIVLVRAPGTGNESRRVEEPDALPVRAGSRLSLEVHLNQPASMYLVWLDTAGQVIPLYPWNNDVLEVKDINVSPPARRPTNVLMNPTLGTSWDIGKRGGLETILLLARKTPLAEGTRLSSLLSPAPPVPQVRQRDEVVILGVTGGDASVQTLTTQGQGAADEPLRALLGRLREHFELIRAVRFAHEGE